MCCLVEIDLWLWWCFVVLLWGWLVGFLVYVVLGFLFEEVVCVWDSCWDEKLWIVCL